MATNADEETQVSDIEALRAAKEAETTKVDDSEDTVDDGQTEDTAEVKDPAETVEEAESETTFTKPIPSINGETPEEYYANLAKAYQESTAEALRLVKENRDLKTAKVVTETATDQVTLTPEQLYIKQKQDEEIADAFKPIRENYPQVLDEKGYEQFTTMANTLGRTILDAEGRLPSAKELYQKTVMVLGWTQDDSKEKLNVALKDGAATTKTSSTNASGKPRSRVTDEMIIANRKMYPGKTDAQIREELEPHVQ